MHSSHDFFGDLYIYNHYSVLSRTARVRCIGLRVAYTAARLVLADTRCKVVVVRAELAGTVRAHPRAARAGTDLERHAAVRTRRGDEAAVVVEIEAVGI